jgi:hypothetical protein
LHFPRDPPAQEKARPAKIAHGISALCRVAQHSRTPPSAPRVCGAGPSFRWLRLLAGRGSVGGWRAVHNPRCERDLSGVRHRFQAVRAAAIRETSDARQSGRSRSVAKPRSQPEPSAQTQFGPAHRARTAARPGFSLRDRNLTQAHRRVRRHAHLTRTTPTEDGSPADRTGGSRSLAKSDTRTKTMAN